MHGEKVSSPSGTLKNDIANPSDLFSLALVEMKILLREVYSRFQTTVAPDMKGSMKLYDQIISARPKGQTCKLVFTPIDGR